MHGKKVVGENIHTHVVVVQISPGLACGLGEWMLLQTN
jgi:hypothetical protein